MDGDAGGVVEGACVAYWKEERGPLDIPSFAVFFSWASVGELFLVFPRISGDGARLVMLPFQSPEMFCPGMMR